MVKIYEDLFKSDKEHGYKFFGFCQTPARVSQVSSWLSDLAGGWRMGRGEPDSKSLTATADHDK